MLNPNAGRALSAAGAILLLISLALTWYHVERPGGIEAATGFESFPRLRWIVAGGAVLVLVSALLRQTRPALIARTVLGVVVGALILRRIIDPPDLSSPVVAQVGMYVGLVAAVMAALGGLVDTGRELAVVTGLARSPLAELPPAGSAAVTHFDRQPERAPGATATRGS